MPNADRDPDGALIGRIKDSISLVSRISSALSGFYPWLYRHGPQGSEALELRQQDRVDRVLLIWWILLASAFLASSGPTRLLGALPASLAVLRIINIIAWNLRVALVETSITAASEVLHSVNSVKRSAILGLVNFIELIVAYAALYGSFRELLASSTSAIDAVGFLYFSAITQLTIGYGDIVPSGWLRLAVASQGLCGVVLVTFTLGRFVALVKVVEAGRSSGRQ